MQNTEKRMMTLLAIGSTTNLAAKAVTAGYTLSKLKSATDTDLFSNFTPASVPLTFRMM